MIEPLSFLPLMFEIQRACGCWLSCLKMTPRQQDKCQRGSHRFCSAVARAGKPPAMLEACHRDKYIGGQKTKKRWKSIVETRRRFSKVEFFSTPSPVNDSTRLNIGQHINIDMDSVWFLQDTEILLHTTLLDGNFSNLLFHFLNFIPSLAVKLTTIIINSLAVKLTVKLTTTIPRHILGLARMISRRLL